MRGKLSAAWHLRTVPSGPLRRPILGTASRMARSMGENGFLEQQRLLREGREGLDWIGVGWTRVHLPSQRQDGASRPRAARALWPEPHA